MGNIDATTGIERLFRNECFELLAQQMVGRLAVVEGGAPTIFPMNYALDGDTVVFRTAPGSKLEAARRSPVCFEIDRFDEARQAGWSVIVAGRLEEVTRYDATTLERVTNLALSPWAGGERAHWLRLRASRVTGRRIAGRHPGAASSWPTLG